MDTRKIARATAFPGCCGISVIKNISANVAKRRFVKWLKNENDLSCLGGLVTAVSKGEPELEKTLTTYGFKLLLQAGNEKIWYRRLRFANW